MHIQNARFGIIFTSLLLTPAISLFAQSNGIPLNTLILNGSATLVNSRIQLTSTYREGGSAFAPTPYILGPNDSFEVTYLYSAVLADSQPADGLAFIAQNTSMGANYLGLDGSGLGFFTLTSGVPAIAATVDYYSNAYTGSPAGSAAIAIPIGQDLVQAIPARRVFDEGGYNGTRFVWVDYDNPTRVFSVYYALTAQKPVTPILTTTLTQDLSSEFGGQVYFGFSGGTGSLDSVQSVFFMAVSINGVSMPGRVN